MHTMQQSNYEGLLMISHARGLFIFKPFLQSTILRYQ